MLMDETEHLVEMGNKVSGSKETVESSKGANEDPDDFAEELAELEEAEDVQESSQRLANDGDESQEVNLLMDSDTESKKSSASNRRPDSNAEDLSSDDELSEKATAEKRRLSTESISNDELEGAAATSAKGTAGGRPGTPCLDENQALLLDPVSDSDAPDSISPTKWDSKGIKIHIRSMEEELDDIESEEECYSEQEAGKAGEVIEKSKEAANEEKSITEPPATGLNPPDPPDPNEVGLIEGEELMDIDEILGDREALSESSDKSVVEAETEPATPKGEAEAQEATASDDVHTILDSDEDDAEMEVGKIEPPPESVVDIGAGGDGPKEVTTKEKRFMTLDPPIGDMDIVEILDDNDGCSAEEEGNNVGSQEERATDNLRPQREDDPAEDNCPDHPPPLETSPNLDSQSDDDQLIIESVETVPEDQTPLNDNQEEAEEDKDLESPNPLVVQPEEQTIEETVRTILNEILNSLFETDPTEKVPEPTEGPAEPEDVTLDLNDEDVDGDDDNLISLDDYFSDSNDSRQATTNNDAAHEPPSRKSISSSVSVADGCDSDGDQLPLPSPPPTGTTKRKRLNKSSGACINPECSTAAADDLYPAPAFVRSYFRLPNDTPVRVCSACLDENIGRYGALWDKFENLSLEFKDLPVQVELGVIASSSDEEEREKETNEKRKKRKPSKKLPSGDDKETLPEEVTNFLEENLETILSDMQDRFDFPAKASAFERSCEAQLEQHSQELDSMFDQLRGMMKATDGFYHKLMEVVLPLHDSLAKALQPPPLTYSDTLVPGSLCYAQWLPGTYRRGMVVKYAADLNHQPMYEVRFDATKELESVFRTLPTDQMAYFERRSSTEPLHFGARVVVTDEGRAWSGMVADVLERHVLVFFEDGQSRYVAKRQVHSCLSQFPTVRHASIVLERHSKPMVRDMFAGAVTREFELERGTYVELYFYSQWSRAKVLAVEQSVVMCGAKGKRQMLYTGSPYIRPTKSCWMVTKRIELWGPNAVVKREMYVVAGEEGRRVQPPRQQKEKKGEEEQQQQQQKEKKEEEPPQQQQERSRRSVEKPQQQQQKQPPPQVSIELRQVAKKSGSGAPPDSKRGGGGGGQVEEISPSVERTSRPRQAVAVPMPSQYYRHVKNMNNATIYLDEDDDKQGQIVSFVAPKKFSKPFERHHCSPQCTPIVQSDLSRYNPLSRPLMAGWKRHLVTTSGRQRIVLYKAPCGRSLRNMYEVHHYLRETHSPFTVDVFEFEADVQCLAEYKVERRAIKWQSADLSEGQEPMPVSCVNYYDQSLPPSCEYSTERTPTEGVALNLDEEFLACCDCEDDCLDKSRCQCWQLTIQGERMRDPEIYENDVGYVYKRLPNPVPTGIYECNARCRCSASCLNRVVQHKIQLKLQVYKTANRGWGIRCLNDVPKGGFICVYAGHLLTEQKANEEGANLGDEYFAELDYIEVAERLKQGYESDVPGDWRSDSEEEEEEEEEDNVFMNSYANARAHPQRKRMSRRVSNMVAKKRSKPQPLRKFFGQNEEIYVMDAKITGNIGRYFNHSCAPNLFVQNVFVDTHDLRFPWVSFFAMHNIRAGSELTWNYNYEVGSVQGKILICQCGAETCRGRIL